MASVTEFFFKNSFTVGGCKWTEGHKNGSCVANLTWYGGDAYCLCTN